MLVSKVPQCGYKLEDQEGRRHSFISDVFSVLEFFFFFCFFFCRSSSLVIMPLKQLPTLTDDQVKDPHGIRQYDAGFRSSIGDTNLKIRSVEDIHLQVMTNIWKHLLNKTYVKVSEKYLRQWVSAFQQYQIISRKLAKWRKSMNGFHTNSVKVKAIDVLKCKWSIWSNRDLWQRKCILYDNHKQLGWWTTQTFSKTEIVWTEDYGDCLVVCHLCCW